MFTGLIQHKGKVTNRSSTNENATVRLTIDTNPPIQVATAPVFTSQTPQDHTRWPGLPQPEESVAVDGCCLTVAEILNDETLAFDVIPQTLSLTTLGNLQPGDLVNLEQCVSPTGLLGGHLVQGHIDGLGNIIHIQKSEDWRLRVALPNQLIRYATPKGSITLAGVSLTIAELDPHAGWIEVALIPTTLQRTTLGNLQLNQPINVEMDTIAKTVVHYLEHFAANQQQPRTTNPKPNALAEAGQ